MQTCNIFEGNYLFCIKLKRGWRLKELDLWKSKIFGNWIVQTPSDNGQQKSGIFAKKDMVSEQFEFHQVPFLSSYVNEPHLALIGVKLT